MGHNVKLKSSKKYQPLSRPLSLKDLNRFSKSCTTGKRTLLSVKRTKAQLQPTTPTTRATISQIIRNSTPLNTVLNPVPTPEIFSDAPTKAPITLSSLHLRSPEARPHDDPSKLRSISNEVANASFTTRDHIPRRKLTPMAIETPSLLKTSQLPLIQLNSWFGLHENHTIVTKRSTSDTDQIYPVTGVSHISDFLLSVNLDGYIDNQDVLLLNYCQSIPNYNRIHHMKVGDNVKLIDYYQVLDGLRLYHHWKLII
ncbi:unnamed protein product [Cyberlindnera jadinii]|uniref:Uncharacterized protein n=1 Tax=Cyberlindnera jadinii (strain ATCC 18201 / CBS 1600 / BCRC 20928 / JCM 3617 / NBRC 0987 / NRRL Y-1542) TaxID=983966 RepID=A0A0H5CAA1_CYBJN|nr:unnamed protein product [Cyberlindnera jadinii]